MLKQNNKTLIKLMINSQARKGQTGDFFGLEPFDYPPSLSVNGDLRFGTKSDILKPLLELQTSTTQHRPAGMDALVFDAPVTVQSMKIPESVTTFYQLKKHFWSLILHRCSYVSIAHVIFDLYLEKSLKTSARIKRGTANSIDFQPTTILPK